MLLKDLKNRSLSFGEGDGGRGQMKLELQKVQECATEADKNY